MNISNSDLAKFEPALPESFIKAINTPVRISDAKIVSIGDREFTMLYADDGTEGAGEGLWPNREDLDELLAYVKEADEITINQFYTKARDENPYADDVKKSWAYFAAQASIEIALWDIVGKQMKKPICELLGGRLHDKLTLYANHALLKDDNTQTIIDAILKARDDGYTAFKFNPFTGRKGIVDRGLKQVCDIRKVIGLDYPLALDPHCHPTELWGKERVADVLRCCKELESMNILFFEEPVMPRSYDEYKEIAAGTKLMIATGERLFHLQEFRPLFDNKSIGLIQPEIGLTGIREAFLIGLAAKASGIKTAFHHWGGPVLGAATCQVQAALPNVFIQEFSGCNPSWWPKDIVSPEFQIKNGELLVPTGTGLGIKVNWEEE